MYSCHARQSTICLRSPRGMGRLRIVDQFRPAVLSVLSVLRRLLLLDGSLRRLSRIELGNNFRVDTVQELLGEDAKQ